MIEYHKPFWKPEMMVRINQSRLENPFENPLELEETLSKTFKKLPLYQTAKHILFLNSATSALEVMALALKLKPNDEVILPAFTHVSTANAFARVGASLKFVDIEPDTLNLDVDKVKQAITSKTKVILPIHYAGLNRDFDALRTLSHAYGISLLEDASHCMNSGYEQKAYGLFGKMGCLSFHQTKNITAGGNGGCLFVEDDQLYESCQEIIHHGTDRIAFSKGFVEQYQWQQLGSELAMPQYQMRFLLEALPYVDEVTQIRKAIWERYRDSLASIDPSGTIIFPLGETCNGHIFYIIADTIKTKNHIMAQMQAQGIQTMTHYEPLHISPMGTKLGLQTTKLEVTESISSRLIRLPIHTELTEEQQTYIIKCLIQIIDQVSRGKV